MTAPKASRWRTLHRRFAFRLVAAMLLVSVPLMVLLAVFLTTSASSSLTASAERKGESIARSVALRMEDWLGERQENVSVLATQASTPMTSEQAAAALANAGKIYHDFDLLELTDLTGKVLASSRSGSVIKAAGQDWFRTAAAGQSTLTSPVREGADIQWIIAQPVLGAGGQPKAVVIGNLKTTVLATLLNPELDKNTSVVAVDARASTRLQHQRHQRRHR